MLEAGAVDRRPALGLMLILLALMIIQLRYGPCTQDDAYISFRYAKNLVEGQGLVFNPGERVEGYTNFLWTLIFAPFIAMGLDPGPVSISLGMLTSLAVLGTSWQLGGRRYLAPLLILCFPGFTLEGIQGLETVPYALLVLLSCRGGPTWPLWAGIAALTRPEGYALFGILFLLRRRPRDILPFLALTVPHIVFRLVYYGDWVPNTFHAKVGGLALSRGLTYLGEVGLAAPLLWAGGLVGTALVFLRASRSAKMDSGLFGASAVFLTFMVIYVAAVGGDFKGTGRFLIPVAPAAALLAQELLGRRAQLAAAAVALVLSIGDR